MIKNEKERKISDIQEIIKKENDNLEVIQKELEKIERNLKDSLEKKSHLVKCLKNFYLGLLNNEDFYNMMDYNLSEIIISLWKLKYKVELCDFPTILDEKSRIFLLDFAKINWKFEKMKKNNLKKKDQSRDNIISAALKTRNLQSQSFHENIDKSGVFQIRAFQKSFRNFENDLEKKCLSFHEVCFLLFL